MPDPSSQRILRLGARGSLLSRMQSQLVADALEKLHPGLAVELVLIKTTGDQVADRPLHAIGGKGLFTKELELALLAGQVDFAVHSFKDVPVTMPLVPQNNLVFAAVPKREDPRDLLVSAVARRIADLPRNARVGTGSLRRRAQLLSLRPDLDVQLIRGNVDTRLKKLRAGEFDAIVLAMAGVRRAGLYDEQDMAPIGPDEMLPCAGQGALAVQCRADDPATRDLLAGLDYPSDHAAVDLERRVVAALEGDCHSPIAAHARHADGQWSLSTAVGRRDGEPPVIRADATGADAESVLARVTADLEAAGARAALAG
ncbi:MAG TPA: hydroxymethylbilane synthase [Tepidisphaeraceae bacterium]|nr:hydroxymethylbilane synthase [Tepidisphaeraceae bacterium]